MSAQNQVDDLILKIENGDFLLPELIELLAEMLIKLGGKERKLDELLQSFASLIDLSRKIDEIHALHFPERSLKKVSQQERFLAQILTGPARKK